MKKFLFTLIGLFLFIGFSVALNIERHNISFSPNGGQGNLRPILLEVGVDTTLSPNAFTKTGYDFIGWNTNADGLGVSFKNRATITMGDSDINLYAQWVANDFKISFWANGGTGFIIPLDITYGKEFTLSTNTFNREGYIFKDWNTNVNGLGRRYSDEELVTAGIGDINLYAQWYAIPYLITYKGTDSTVNANPSSYTIADPNIVLSHVIQHNKAFDGWYIDSLFQTQISEIPQGSIGDITLYAKWSNEYNLIYFSNGGNGKTQIESLTIIGANYTTRSNMFSCPGYEFEKWNSRPDGLGTSYNENQNIILEDDIDFVLFAIWKPIEYKIDYRYVDNTPNINPSRYTPATPTFILSDLSRNGYSFNGWFSDSLFTEIIQFIPEGSLGDTSIFADWEINYYNIDYYSNGGYTNMKSQTFPYHTDTVLLDKPFSRKGYRFLGWNTTPSGDGLYYSNKNIINNIEANLTLYAQWEIEEYVINYHNLQGSVNLNPKKYTLYTPTYVLNTLVQVGYTFNGWFLDEQHSTPIAHIELGDTGNINVYAQWHANNYYIRYQKNEGKGNMLSQSIPYSKDTVLSSNTFQRKGYTFTHWNTKADDSETVYSDQQDVVMNADDLTLFAQWSLNEYSISYHNLDGTVNINPKIYDVTMDHILLPLSKKGYSFLGWFTEEHFANQINNIQLGDTGNLELYANWGLNNYKISYHPNGGLGMIPTQDIPYGNNAVLAPFNMTRKGYKFTHWNTSADNKGTNYTDKQGISMDTTNLELFAQWQIIDYKLKYHNLLESVNFNPSSYNVSTEKTLLLLVNDAYVFHGWFIDENYSSKLDIIALGDTGDVNLYAKWELKSFDVTITSGEYGTVTVEGATANTITKNIAYNGSLNSIVAINEIGSTKNFVGWSDGVRDNPRVLSNITSDTLITALWQTIVSIAISDTLRAYTGKKHDVTVNLSQEVKYNIQYKEKSKGFYSDAKPKYVGKYDVKVSITEEHFSGVEYSQFIITPKTLIINTNKDQEKSYGDIDPDTLLSTAEGLIDGDIIIGKLERVQGEAPGQYPILLGSIQALSPDKDSDLSIINNNINNYNIVLNSANFHINSEIEIFCKWEYMLVVNNENNEMASYQWYKDGLAIDGATSQSYYNKQHTLCGTYQCEVTLIGSNIKIKTEPVDYEYCEATLRSDNLTLYPNPSIANTPMHLSTLSNSINTEKNTYIINIYSLTGVLLKSTNTNSLDVLDILAPSQNGIYNIVIHCNGNYIGSKTLIVK